MPEIATPVADSAAEAAQPDHGEDETAVHSLRNVNVIVKELPGADEHEVLTALQEITRT